jgi:nucleoid-associated protein YgaU
MFGSALDFEQAFATIEPMNRTRVRRRRLGLVLAVALAAALGTGPLAGAIGLARPSAPAPVAAHRVVVRPGDTLWAIAERVAPGQDPRPLVDAIVASNHVDPGALVPGQTLVVPASG